MPDVSETTPSTEQLKSLSALVKKHRGLEAWSLLKDLPDLKTWRGYHGRKLASQLAQNLGNSSLSSALDLLNWRAHRDNHGAYFRALFQRFSFRSQSLLLPEMEARLTEIEEGSEIHCDLLGLIASAYSHLREYEKAHKLIEKAIQASREPAWLLSYQAITFRNQDRYEDVLRTSEKINIHYGDSV